MEKLLLHCHKEGMRLNLDMLDGWYKLTIGDPGFSMSRRMHIYEGSDIKVLLGQAIKEIMPNEKKEVAKETRKTRTRVANRKTVDQAVTEPSA